MRCCLASFPNPKYPVGLEPESISAGDFNGDGVTDLVTANASLFSEGISVLLGKGDGTFAVERRFSVGRSPNDVSTDDFNGDGVTDQEKVYTNTYNAKGELLRQEVNIVFNVNISNEKYTYVRIY